MPMQHAPPARVFIRDNLEGDAQTRRWPKPINAMAEVTEQIALAVVGRDESKAAIIAPDFDRARRHR
ncbi:hypothetical protein ABIE89_006942 [Bradyrhizobium niftali]